MTKLEQQFANLWRMLGHGSLVAEHQFDAVRAWRFDFAHVESRTAVELEGGVFRPRAAKCPTCGQTPAGRHIRPSGFHDDCDKYNAAAGQGWAVLRFTAKHLNEQPAQCVEMVNAAIARRA